MSHDLTALPSIGKRMAKMLEEIGIETPSDLIGQNPLDLYERSCQRAGMRVAPCVLYTYRCAVYAAETGEREGELTKWWHWKDRAHGNEG